MGDFKNQLDFKNKELIGNGASGIAYKIFNNKDKNYYCLKQILLKNDDKIKQAENEVNILKTLNHENIVKYYGSYKDENSFYIIMEYCDNSDLNEFIKQHKDNKKLIEQNIIYSIIKGICSGLKEIHDKNLIHRDLKPENIFISKEHKIKIGDFGISKQLIGTKHAKTIGGTTNYMAPEILNGEKYDNKVDIWALGCIIYELCTLNICFESEYEVGLVKKITEGNYDKNKLREYNSEWINLIELLLKIDKNDRPNIIEVYEKLDSGLNKISNNYDNNMLGYLENENSEEQESFEEQQKLYLPNSFYDNLKQYINFVKKNNYGKKKSALYTFMEWKENELKEECMVSHIDFEFKGQFITLHFENVFDNNDVIIKNIIKYLEQEYNARVLYEESDLNTFESITMVISL